MYIKDLGRVRKCKCAPHKGPCKCGTKTKDVDPAPGVMSAMAEESTAISTARAAHSNQNMSTPLGAQPAYTTFKSAPPEDEEPEECEPDAPEVEAEKSVADRLRQQRDGRDPHNKNFLSAFYAARALERSKRQA
jgi:hypothetical protein